MNRDGAGRFVGGETEAAADVEVEPVLGQVLHANLTGDDVSVVGIDFA